MLFIPARGIEGKRYRLVCECFVKAVYGIFSLALVEVVFSIISATPDKIMAPPNRTDSVGSSPRKIILVMMVTKGKIRSTGKTCETGFRDKIRYHTP